MDKLKTGEIIRKTRIKKGYTQEELGTLIGVSNKAVSRWENGVSFPDIGVLESLSEILELKIQDIVTGEITENNNENSEVAITELVRVSKIQAKENYRNLITNCMGVIIIGYLLIRGYSGLSGRIVVAWVPALYCWSLIAVLIAISAKSIRDKESINPFNDKISKCLTIVAIITGVYSVALMCFVMCICNQGNTPFNIELISIGRLLNSQLAFVFMFNIIALIVEWFRMNRKETHIHFGMYVSSAVLHLIFVYSDVLHRLSIPRDFWHMFIINTVAILIETTLVIAFTLIIKKNMKSE